MAKRGRKSLKVEVDTNKLFNLSYYTLARALKSPSVTENKKIEIALQVYCKHLPQKLEHSGEVKGTSFIIIEKYIQPKEEDVPSNRIAGVTEAIS